MSIPCWRRGGLLTLTGVGGAGKTRLAEEAARGLLSAYPDGIWVADLVPVADPRLVADTVASALGLDPGAGSDPLRTLVTRLAPRTLLLVLDNCEHLLAACAALAIAVRRSCPGVTVLATSTGAVACSGRGDLPGTVTRATRAWRRQRPGPPGESGLRTAVPRPCPRRAARLHA